MKRLRLSFRRNSFLVKVLMSYIVTGSILLSILSYVMYNSYSQNALNEIDKNAQKMLEQSSNVVKTYWSSTLTYLGQFHVQRNVPISTNVSGSFEYTPIYDGLYSESFDGLRTGAISSKLVDVAASNPIIASIYLYNKRADLIFSNFTVSQPIHEFLDQRVVDILEHPPSRNELFYAPRKVHYVSGSETIDYNTISVVFIEDYINNEPASAIVFNLKQSALQQIVKPESVDDANQIFIMDRKGLVISHPQMELVDQDISNEAYIQTILTSNADSGYFTADVRGSRSLVTYKKSYNAFGWKCIGTRFGASSFRVDEHYRGNVRL